MHRELRPEKVFYCTGTKTQGEAEELLMWFVRNTQISVDEQGKLTGEVTPVADKVFFSHSAARFNL